MFSKLSYALFQGVHHNICRYIRVCQTVRKKTFAGKPIEDRYIIGTVRRDILTAVRHYGWTSAYRIRLYYTSRLMLFFRHSAFHCRPVICLISTFPLYIRKAGDGKLYIKTDVMPNDNDD